MRTLGFVLLAVALVVLVMIVGLVRGARRRQRARRSYIAQQTGGDDSPTGYVQGVWLLGGGDAPKSQGDHHHSGHHSGHDSGSSSSHDGGSAGNDGGGPSD